MKNYNILDLFCGTGGFSHGFEKADYGFKVACAIDILEDAVLTTKANHPDCLAIQGDIRTLRPSKVKKRLGNRTIDVIVGGPPCQGFSSLRPFRSSTDDDPRNSLFEQFALFVNYFRPKVFVMENVVGLVTHAGGRTLQKIEACFADMDYNTDWKILNTANYGIPQKRERFVLIGVVKGGEIEFPSPTHSFKGRVMGCRDKNKVISLQTSSLSPALSVMDAIGDLPIVTAGRTANKYTTSPKTPYQRDRRSDSKELTLHTASTHSKKMLEIIRHSGDSIDCIPKHLITSGFSSCYSRLKSSEPATTLTVKFLNPASSKCIHPSQDRALTPREGARIQSFDDSYIFCGSKTSIVTQIGNAVPPLLGQAIAIAVYKILRTLETSNKRYA